MYCIQVIITSNVNQNQIDDCLTGSIISPVDQSSNINHYLTKEEYLKEFNSKKNGPLHEQLWVKEKVKKFHEKIDQLKQFYCTNCQEMWPSFINYCKECQKDQLKFSKENLMSPNFEEIPDDIRKHLEQLTMVEEMLISPVLPIMSIYRLPNQQLVSRGFIANFAQDVTNLTKILPRLPKDVPVLVVKRKDQTNKSSEFRVNRARIESVLNYLCTNNKSWQEHGITINFENIQSLPENGKNLKRITLSNY